MVFRGGENALQVSVPGMGLMHTPKFENDLLRHNLVVFRGGGNALQVSVMMSLALVAQYLCIIAYHNWITSVPFIGKWIIAETFQKFKKILHDVS